MPTQTEISKMEVGSTYKEPLSEFENLPHVGERFMIPYFNEDKISILDGLPASASVTRLEVIEIGEESVIVKVRKRDKGTDCKTADYSGMFRGNVCPTYNRPCNIRTKEFCPLD